jgi:hypothetical protein
MDKPVSMSVKDYLIRKLAVKLLTSEKTIEAVVNHQFQAANEAMDTNNSIEISGFGKLFFNNKKSIKRIGKLNAKRIAIERILANPETTEQKRKSTEVTLANTLKTIETLKNRTTYED